MMKEALNCTKQRLFEMLSLVFLLHTLSCPPVASDFDIWQYYIEDHLIVNRLQVSFLSSIVTEPRPCARQPLGLENLGRRTSGELDKARMGKWTLRYVCRRSRLTQKLQKVPLWIFSRISTFRTYGPQRNRDESDLNMSKGNALGFSALLEALLELGNMFATDMRGELRLLHNSVQSSNTMITSESRLLDLSNPRRHLIDSFA